MTTVHSVTCTGKTLPELKKALQAALRDYDSVGGSVSVSGPAKSFKETAEEVYVDETEISNVHQMHQPREVSASPALNAPYTAPTTPAQHVNLNEVDNRGVPWISGIHSDKKTFMANGNWKSRRGTTDAQVAQAEAQYLTKSAPVTASYTQPVQHSAPIQNPVQQHVVTPPVQQNTHQFNQAPVIPPMGMPTGHTVQSFTANFTLILSQLISEGKVSAEYIEQCKAYFQAPQIWQITDAQKAEMFETFAASGIVQKVG